MPTETGESNGIDDFGILLATLPTETVPQCCMQYVCLNGYLYWLLVMDR